MKEILIFSVIVAVMGVALATRLNWRLGTILLVVLACGLGTLILGTLVDNRFLLMLGAIITVCFFFAGIIMNIVGTLRA